MAKEPIDRIISKSKAANWPASKRREYLITALQCEKGRYRRKRIADALCKLTTNILRGRNERT